MLSLRLRGLFTGVALALVANVSAQAHNVCGPNEFAVSVQSDPTVYCVAARPCSGQYALLSRQGSVGACPNHAGCALLPQTPSVMGCVKAGLPDVSYVNADGSLTRNGVVVAQGGNANADKSEYIDAHTNANSNANANTNANSNANANTDANTDANTNVNTNVNTNINANINANTVANVNGTTVDTANATTTTTTAANSTTTAAPDTKAPTPSKATEPVGTVSTAPTSGDGSATHVVDVARASVASNTQSMGDLNGDSQSKAKVGGTSTSGFGSTVAIVVGCLAVVAIIAGVFVLRKNKEGTELETPVDGVNEYGNGGVMTPKDQVQLL